MSCLIDVAVPKVPVGAMIYEAPEMPDPGSRVIVEVKNNLRVGFVLGKTENELPAQIKIKSIQGIIDSKSKIDYDLWDMILWVSRVSMCGIDRALRAVLPAAFINGEELELHLNHHEDKTRIFHETNYFNPSYSERVKFYLDEIEKSKRTLILFPTKAGAKSFHSYLVKQTKFYYSCLWSEAKSWHDWELTYKKYFDVIIGAPGAVFAPLMPDKIIIEDEANPLHMIPYSLNISSRSLAGRRAQTLKAELITAGNMPSVKTFLRARPEEKIKPERKNIILADIYRSRKENINGIEGNIPFTFSLIKRTYKELAKKNNVLWILNRTGESSEVFCENCGSPIKCKNCGGIMKSIHDGNLLRCHICGDVADLPNQCSVCGYKFFRGKRPGIEALLKIVKRYYEDSHIYVEGSNKLEMHGLVISTKKGLELCRKIKPSLIAWLDLDLDLSGHEYNTRVNVFRELYESYWRERERSPERKILIQARKSGMRLANFLPSGWSSFLKYELNERKEYSLPPYSYMIELECSSKIIRGEMIKIFDDSGIFVMDPGDDSMPLYIQTKSLEAIRNIIEPLKPKIKQGLKITVRSE